MLDSVQRVPDQPILICTFKETITGEDLQQAWMECIAQVEDVLAQGDAALVYRITDMREVAFTFAQLVSAMAASVSGRNQPGSTDDPRFIELAVTNPTGLVHFGVRSLAQSPYGGIRIKVFETVEAALAYARQEIG